LKTSESYYQHLYECAPVGYFELGEDSRITKVNLTGAQLLGFPRTGLFGRRFSAFVKQNFQSHFYAHLQQVFITKIKQSCKLELMKRGGASFYSQLESIVIMDASQDAAYLRISVLDINEYQLTEEALRSSKEKYRSIIDTTKEWIWSTDVKGLFTVTLLS
jgi:PAS domain S-box-containing protein